MAYGQGGGCFEVAMGDYEISSLQQLIETVLGIRSGLEGAPFLWYRGLSCSSLTLLPKIMRAGKTIDEVFERERRLLTRFRQRSMAYWPAGYQQNDWEHLFTMQHYGMPTRLLDWSENLFVAAYFALWESPKHDHDGACVPVIWCIDPVRWNRAMPGLSEYGDSIRVLTTVDEEIEGYRPETNRRRSRSPVAIFGSNNSNRIVAQRGTFIVWGAEVKSPEAFANDQEGELLWRLRLVADQGSLFRDLETLGFGETMVFPELNALATELARTEGWR